jgi:hypothetical protein
LKEQAALLFRLYEIAEAGGAIPESWVKEVNYSTVKFAGVTRNVSDDGKNIWILFSSHVGGAEFRFMLNNYGKSKELMLMGLPGGRK